VEQRLLWSQRGWVGAQVGRGWARRPHDTEELRRLVNPAGLTLGWERRTLSVGVPEAYHYQSSLNDPGWGPVQWRAWRFADPAIRSDNRRVRLPHWLLALICGALPFTFLTLSTCRAVRRRAAAGECPKCGYDLRATPERCPECGDVAGRIAGCICHDTPRPSGFQ
jgi:hypothetical protein